MERVLGKHFLLGFFRDGINFKKIRNDTMTAQIPFALNMYLFVAFVFSLLK